VSVPARTRTLAGALVAGLLMVVLTTLPGGAGAQAGATPTPCTGEPLLTDKAGDATVDPTSPLGLASDDGLPNQDVKSFFFNYKDGVLTANIQVANLNTDVPPFQDSQGGEWNYVIYTDGDTRRFVRAVNDGSGTITYAYGNITTSGPLTGLYNTDGDTKGKYFEGPDGIIQIEIPAEAGAKAGASLKNVVVTMDDIQGINDQAGFNNHADVAPDDGDVLTTTGGIEYVVTPCPTTPTSTTPGTGTIPGTTTTELPLKVTKVLDGAKKAKKKKALRVTVNATDTITSLSLSLKGKSGTGKTYASAKVASLSGTATLKLKLKAKLKAGSYSLVAKGSVNGTKLSKKLSVKVKK
jgi:hypothetical protein